MTLTDVLKDFAYLSVLLMIGYELRKHVVLFQKYFIPSSLIAGVLGMFLSQNWLGTICPFYIPFSSGIGQWSGALVIFVCATMFLGLELNQVGRDGMATTFLAGACHQAQMCVGLAIAALFGLFMKGLPYQFGYMGVWGFYAGHGNATTVGNVIQDAGYWDDAVGVGVTFATIGILCGVIIGMILINWGAKKGYTRQKMDSSYVEKKDITGILPAEQRKPAAMGISNPSVIDPMAFQMMIVGTIIAVSHFLREAIIKVFPFWERIPLYTMCLIMGAIIGVAISKTKYNQYIDRGSMKRISGVALEYAIAMNVATIKLSVLASYLVPILLTSAAITAVTAVICIVLAKKCYGKDWFEMAMGAYGQCTGSLATGLLLIKVLDPNGDTLAAESVSGSSTLGSFWQQPYNTIGPMMILASPVLVTLGTAGFLAVFLAAGTLLFGRTVKKS